LGRLEGHIATQVPAAQLGVPPLQAGMHGGSVQFPVPPMTRPGLHWHIDDVQY